MTGNAPREQMGECQRCGVRVAAAQLEKDGRNPLLLVCDQCYDPRHPAEQPFKPKQIEGKPKFPVAPDLWPGFHATIALSFPSLSVIQTLVLTGVLTGSLQVTLTWTPALLPRYRIARYAVFRKSGAGAYGLHSTLVLTYDDFGTAVQELKFVDNTVVAGTSYTYRVDAVAEKSGDTASSNEVTVAVP